MPTLSEALHTFLQVERRAASNQQYHMVLSRLVDAIGPARQVERVTFEDLLDYQANLRAHLKPLTVAGYTSTFKSFFNWCVKRGYIQRSPAADLARKKAARGTHVRAIPPDELTRLIEYARLTSPRNYAMLLFMADTGCRVGGLVSLRISTLHLEDGFATLDEKGGEAFTALFSSVPAQALTAWLKKRPTADHDYVFTSQAAGHPPLSRESVYSIVKELSRKTGASREWSPHSIRHRVGHAYAKAGVPVTITQHKLGHSSPDITGRYYYPEDYEYLQLVSERLALAALKPDEELTPAPLIKPSRRSG